MLGFFFINLVSISKVVEFQNFGFEMGYFRFLLLSAVLVAFALGAPQEKEEDVATVADDKTDADSEDKSAVVVADETWETWLSENTSNIVLGTIGVVLIIGGITLASYYFYFRTNYQSGLEGKSNEGINDPYGYQYRDYSTQGQVPGYPNQYYSTSIGR